MKSWGHLQSGGTPGCSRGWWRMASPGMGPTKAIPGKGIAGPRTRLLREEGVTVARLIPRAGRHPGREDRQIHAVQAV